MPKDAALAKPGLGTGIVQALTKQLDASIKLGDAGPGAALSVAHTQIAIVQGDKPREAERAV